MKKTIIALLIISAFSLIGWLKFRSHSLPYTRVVTLLKNDFNFTLPNQTKSFESLVKPSMRGADLYLIKITTTKEEGQAFIAELRHAQEYNAGWQYSTNSAYTELANWWLPETLGTCERTHVEKELGSCAITVTFADNGLSTFYIEAYD